jgi:hypothetical protein
MLNVQASIQKLPSEIPITSQIPYNKEITIKGIPVTGHGDP